MCRSLPFVSASAMIAVLALGAGAQDEKKPATPAPAGAKDEKKPAAPAPAGAQDPKKAGTPAPAPSGQDEKKAEASGPGQDKTAISQTLDGWYKLTARGEQGEEHIGYMHASIRSDNQLRWRWTFDMTGEVDLLLADPKEPSKRVPVTFSSRLTANLDDAFMPVQAEEIALLGSAEVKTVVTSDEQGRRLDVAVGGERRSFSLRSEEEVHYGLFLMFLSLRQNGALARPGARKAFLAHVDAQGGAPFVEVTFQIRETVKKEYLGRKDVSVTPVTFLKPPPALARDYELTEAFVDRYGRIVEASTRGG
ncbi:MAG TPA: hypothetical protein VEJ18_02465, partial [Planctomycetota bacterium]|nr:hypothetical protein [Planctomycetota bacterium]